MKSVRFAAKLDIKLSDWFDGRLSRRSIDFLHEKRQEEAELLANEIKGD